MWPTIRTALLRPQTILVLALLFLVTDALLSMFSPASAAAHPDHLHPASFPGTETLLEAPYDDDEWLLPAKTYAGNRYTGLTQIDKVNVGTLRMAWETNLADDGEQEAAPLIWNGTMYLSTPHDGVLALDASNGKLRWQSPYNPKYVLLYAVNRGVGLADGPVLFNGRVAGQNRPLVAIGDKAGNFLVLDRTTGKVVHRLALDDQDGLNTQPSRDGTRACPNHGGGIEWNGGAYDPASNSFLVPSTEECAVWKITSDAPQYIPGQPYTGGPLPKRQNGTGLLTSIDVSTGKIRWRKALLYPAEGGVLITASGLAFTSDVGGNLYAFDATSGRQYWKEFTGSAVVAPISAYRLNGSEYLAVVVGEAGNQQTPNLPASRGSRVIAYRLGSAPTVVNDATGQVALANVTAASGGEPAAAPTPSTGSAPYTMQQVARGSEVYAKACAACHGANLQGLSAPALTGPGFGHSHLNGAQLRGIVTQSMPLTAPGSLPAEDYAAVMAFMLSYDCVPPADNSKPFPTTAIPALQQVTLGGTTCAPKASVPTARR